MTKEELQELYESCLPWEDFDDGKYQTEIKNRKGAWFTYNNEDSKDYYDESMIDYMKEQGFIVLDDPYAEEMCDAKGWVVFPKMINNIELYKGLEVK